MLFLLALVSANANAQAAFDHKHVAWNALLAKHVAWNSTGTTSTVDYAGFKNDQFELKTYLAKTSAVSESEFKLWTINEQRAFLLNAYNAYTVDLILTKYPDIKSIKDLGSLFGSPWSKPFFNLLGKKRSLDDVEHKLLRGSKNFDEPRIHFAANCASIGCPALRPEAFKSNNLDAQLEDQTKRFLSDRTRNRFEKSKDTLLLSSIFKWYGEDFEKGKNANSLHEFLARYAGSLGMTQSEKARLANKQINIEFLEYDWSLNRTR